jgi:hypothetical protein
MARSTLITRVLHHEFLKYRWVTHSTVPFREYKSNPIAYAHDTRAFGPDLGGRRSLTLDRRTSGQSAYHNFASTRREELNGYLPRLAATKISQRVAKEWSKLTTEEKAQWA